MFRPTSRIFTPTLLNITSRRAFSSTPKPQDVAKLTLCGRIVTEPETITTPSGNSFLKYTVATGHGRGEQRRTTFWRVAVFDERQKELLGFVGKGAMVFVEADIETKSIEGEDGKKQNFINLFQRNMNILARARPHPDQAEGAEGAEGAEHSEQPAEL